MWRRPKEFRFEKDRGIISFWELFLWVLTLFLIGYFFLIKIIELSTIFFKSMTLIKTLEILKLKLKVLQLQLMILLLKKKLTVPNLDDPTMIILHHGGGWLDFAGVNAYHKMKWGFKSSLGYYIGYQDFIDRNGKVTHGRADNEEGAHTKGYNKRTIGICLAGDGTKKDFTPEQYASLNKLVKRKMEEYSLRRTQLHGHFEFSATLCPSEPLKKWILDFKKVA